MCTSRCGVLATVENGILTQVNADPEHPNSCVCVKGTAAPEIVYSADRLKYPMVRTRPKGDPDPGWLRIDWGHALNGIAARLNHIKENFGAEAVVFSRATTAGSAASDYDGWLQRLANAFGSPNLLTSNHICTWNRRSGSKYTYGVGMPLPDFDNSQCMLLWGINPPATSPAQAVRINRARNRGAKLIVVDPRKSAVAAKADCWLRVRPGADGELAMAMIHVLLEENRYDDAFTRAWTNAPFLVRSDNQQLVTAADLLPSGSAESFICWDERSNAPVTWGKDHPNLEHELKPALFGCFNVPTKDERSVECRPALEVLRSIAARYAPELSEKTTTVPAAEVRKAVRFFATEKPSSYCTWVGLEQDSDAMQTNRAVCCFYALTGQFDSRGSNVLFETTPTNKITGRELLAQEQSDRRLGAMKHPLGPPVDGLVQASQVYEAILTQRPYPLKAMVLFGSDPLLGHGDPVHGRAALAALDFYVHVDTSLNPSAIFADFVLPAASCWEREALMPFFEIAEDTINWVQLRPSAIAPLYESRSDTAIIFELAERLGLSKHFFDGDIDSATNYQLAPSGLSVAQLRANPIGLRSSAATRYSKYAEMDSRTQQPKGFDTPTGKIEIYSTSFAKNGYPPLPEFQSSGDRNAVAEYPLTLTFFRDIHFCDEQHRNIPRLRRSVPDPFLEIHPSAAREQEIGDGDWIFLETKTGKVKLKAKFSDSLHPSVVATVYGWWQACEELKLAGHDPFSQSGANLNLLVPNTDVDPISASVAHRAQQCRITKAG